jgi:hypothetical protein
MLNNMVSPIDHVVMNHQNQTRTNDIWRHVRYNVKCLFYPCVLHNDRQNLRVRIFATNYKYTALAMPIYNGYMIKLVT